MGVLRGQDGVPVVNNGVMYITSAWSKLFALDARIGTLLWMYEAVATREHIGNALL
jgi:quinohemoprotein ethanol dehydrogenase